MRWMEIAWAEQGTAEIEGPASNPRIVDYFRKSGRSDVTDDETPWCAGFMSSCLIGAGLPVPPLEKRLLAAAYAEIGTPLDAPRVGAIAIIDVGTATASGRHCTFVTGWSETTIAGLGGNQANAVNVTHFKREKVVAYRWPEPPSSAKELATAGAPIVLAAFSQIRAAWRGILSLFGSAVAQATAPDAPAAAPKVSGHVQSLLSDAQLLERFGIYCWRNAGWVLGALALWWLGKMALSAGWIAEASTRDLNTGATARRVADGDAA